MKKYLAVLLALALICSGAVAYASAELIDSCDEVSLRPILRYGDAAAAEGIDIHTSLTSKGHLFWDTMHSVGREAEVESVFRFSPVADYGEYPFYNNGVYMYSDFDMEFDMDRESGVMHEVLKQLVDSTPAGQMSETVLKMSDYYDYYPISLGIDVPGFGFDFSLRHFGDDEGDQWQREREIHRIFSEFFRIPVLENDYRSVHVEKNLSGNLCSWGVGWAGDEEDWDTYNINTCSVILPDRVYFTVDNRSQMGQPMDFSHVPGGYGIYCLPYESQYATVLDTDSRENVSAAVDAEVRADELAMVYPLREEQRVCFFLQDEQGRLLLITETDGLTELTVIHAESLEILQQLVLIDSEDRDEILHLHTVFIYEDFLAFEMSGNCLGLLSIDASGKYVPEFIVELCPMEELYWLSYDAKMDWNGEKLAVTYFKTPGSTENHYVADYYLAVYDKSGLLCFMEFDSSLSCLAESVGDYRRTGVYGLDPEPIRPEWN